MNLEISSAEDFKDAEKVELEIIGTQTIPTSSLEIILPASSLHSVKLTSNNKITDLWTIIFIFIISTLFHYTMS